MTTHSTPRHATVIWLLLVAFTLLSWWLVEDHVGTPHVTAGLVLLIAAFKARWVALHYMDLATAPIAWRLLFEAWVLVVSAMLAAGLWFSWG